MNRIEKSAKTITITTIKEEEEKKVQEEIQKITGFSSPKKSKQENFSKE